MCVYLYLDHVIYIYIYMYKYMSCDIIPTYTSFILNITD